MGDSDLNYYRRICSGLRRKLTRAWDWARSPGYLVKIKTSFSYPINRLVRDGARRFRNKKAQPVLAFKPKLPSPNKKPSNIATLVRKNWNNQAPPQKKANYIIPKDYAIPRIKKEYSPFQSMEEYLGSNISHLVSEEKYQKAA